MPFGRRGFLKLLGTGAVAVAAAKVLPPFVPPVPATLPVPAALPAVLEETLAAWQAASWRVLEVERQQRFEDITSLFDDQRSFLRMPPSLYVRAERLGVDEEWWNALQRQETVPVRLALPNGLLQFDAFPLCYTQSLGHAEDGPTIPLSHVLNRELVVRSQVEIMPVGEITVLPLPKVLQPYTLETALLKKGK